MNRKLTCIECPLSCRLSVEAGGGRALKVEGNKCPKGETYAGSEVANPCRVLTGTVLAQGMATRMVPVRTDKPVPRDRLLDAMSQVRKVRLVKPVKAGEVIIHDLLGLGVNLIATRSV